MRYVFGDYELDEQLYELRRAGTPVALDRKVFDVLAYLLEHHDRLVPKEELLDKLWPGQVVGEAALTRCITAARKVLGDDGTRQEFIKTQYGRGYRFVAPVTIIAPPVLRSKFQVPRQEEVGNSQYSVVSSQQAARQTVNGKNTGQAEGVRLQAAGPPRFSPSSLPPAACLSQDVGLSSQNLLSSAPRLGWPNKSLVRAGILLLAGILVMVWYLSQFSSRSPQYSELRTEQVLPLPNKPSIIVLPFVNLSGNPEQEYFSDGITEEITNLLSRIASLFVIARTSAFTYNGKAAKVQEISREIGVRYVLEGSARKTNEQLRVNVQLVDATTGERLWSERYDRPLKDIFALQDEIVQKIVTTLKQQLTLQEQGWAVRKRTDNPEAYDYFLRGREFIGRNTKEATVQARQLFEKALALDSQYTEAVALLGFTYYREWSMRYSMDPQTLERAFELAQQAVALDDSLPYPHSLLSFVYVHKQQYEQAIAEGERAIALDPNNAEESYHGHAHVLNCAGKPEEAIKMMEQAMRLTPRYPPIYLFQLGWAYQLAGRSTEAVATLKEFVSRRPNHVGGYGVLAGSCLQQWTFQQSMDTQTLVQAVAAAKRMVAVNNSDQIGHAVLGYIYLWQKHYEQALAEIEQAGALDTYDARGYAILAAGLSLLGRSEDALRMVEQALHRKSYVADEHLSFVGTAYYLAGRPEEAVASLKQYLTRYPNILSAHLMLAAVYSELGRDAEAQAEAAEVLRRNPQFSLDVHKQRAPIKDPAMLERHLAALRKAGLK